MFVAWVCVCTVFVCVDGRPAVLAACSLGLCQSGGAAAAGFACREEGVCVCVCSAVVRGEGVGLLLVQQWRVLTHRVEHRRHLAAVACVEQCWRASSELCSVWSTNSCA